MASLAPLLVLVLLAVTAHAAQVTLNTPSGPWQAGSIVTVTWQVDPNAAGPMTANPAHLVLMRVNGNQNNMLRVADMGAVRALDGGFQWTVPANIVNAQDYALAFEWTGQPITTFRYSAPFAIVGGTNDMTVFIATSTTSSTRSATPAASSAATTTSAPKPTTTSLFAEGQNNAAAAPTHAVAALAAAGAAALMFVA